MNIALEVNNSTDVRKHWSDFVDEVTNKQIPKLVTRNNKSNFMSISLEQTKLLLAAYRFNVVLTNEDDNTFTAELEDFDLFSNESTKELALSQLAKELIEYAEDYMNDIQLYYNAPNRKPHFPYVLNVLLQDDFQGVMDLLNADI